MSPNPNSENQNTSLQALPNQTEQDIHNQGVISRSAQWFYLIGGISIVNTIMTLTGSDLVFLIGLGFSMVLDSFLPQETLPIKLLLAIFFLTMGFFAAKGKKWAFIVGMLFYGLDAALLLILKSWLMVAFHLYALFHMYPGLKAAIFKSKNNELN